MASMKRASFGRASISSRASSVFTDDLRPEDLDDAELLEAIDNVTTSIRIFTLENEVMERYLSHMDPSILPELHKLLDHAASNVAVQSRLFAATTGMLSVQQSISSMRDPELISSPSTYTTKSMNTSSLKFGSSYFERGPRINLPTKMDVIAREMEDMRRELTILQEKSQKSRTRLRAQHEEMHLMLQELDDSKAILENMVLQDKDAITGHIPAERFVRHMDEWLKCAESVVEKLRLRTSTLKAANVRMRQQLEQKEELGESLHPVDFEQLKIENKEFVERIEQKNYTLLELKRMTGNCSLLLTNHKKTLMVEMTELAGLRAKAKSYQTQVQSLDKECTVVEAEVDKAEEQYHDIQNLMNTYTAPDVMEYIKKKAELHDLKKSIKVWTRRKNIQQTALKTCNAQLSRAKAVTGVTSSSLGFEKKDKRGSATATGTEDASSEDSSLEFGSDLS